MWEHYNIQMDREAKDHWTATADILDNDRPIKIFGEPGSLWINGEKIVVQMKKRLISYIRNLNGKKERVLLSIGKQ